MKLYSGPLSMFGAKAEIALREKGIDFELVMVPFEMKTLYQPKHPEVARINPKRQVPVLVWWRFYSVFLLTGLGIYLMIRELGLRAVKELVTIGWRRRAKPE